MSYTERKLTDVDVWGIQVHHYQDGTYGVSGSAKFQISTFEGEDNGPQATISLAYPIDKADPTVLEAERVLVTGALALVGHLASKDLDSVLAVLSEKREYNFQNPNPFAQQA